MSETLVLNCLLCGTKCPSRSSLTRHIYEHLLYRKYECSCGQSFYTEDERETHCRNEGHFHDFEAKLSPYCEIYANQLLKDAEYVPIHGIDAVVMQRFQANMAYDIAMNNLSKNRQEENFKPSSSSEQPQTSSTSTLQTLLNAMPSPTTENTGGLRESGYKASRAKCDTNRIPNENCMDIEVIKCVKATEMVSEALRTSTFETHCMICKTLTPSEYVLRKLHVSLSHMNKDHTHSDYVEILSDLMKKAYPTLPNNDLQCQIGGCRKEYKSQSARRSHVLRVHFQRELCCPLKCSYRSNDFANVNSHLKEDHGLKNGYLSIENRQVRDQFSKERIKHNNLLNNLVLLAFPCPIVDSKPTSTNIEHSPGEVVQKLMSHIRERSRTFQQAPPNPLRLYGASSVPDSSQEMLSTSSSSTDGSSVSDLESNDVSAEKNAVHQSGSMSVVKSNVDRRSLVEEAVPDDDKMDASGTLSRTTNSLPIEHVSRTTPASDALAQMGGSNSSFERDNPLLNAVTTVCVSPHSYIKQDGKQPATSRVLERSTTSPPRSRRCVECYRKLTEGGSVAYARKKARQVRTRCSQCKKHVCLECFNTAHQKYDCRRYILITQGL